MLRRSAGDGYTGVLVVIVFQTQRKRRVTTVVRHFDWRYLARLQA